MPKTKVDKVTVEPPKATKTPTVGGGGGGVGLPMTGLAAGATKSKGSGFRWPWQKKKDTGGLISAQPMTAEEQGAVPSAKDLIALKGEQDLAEEWQRMSEIEEAEESEGQKERKQRKQRLNPDLPAAVASKRVFAAGSTFWSVLPDGKVGAKRTLNTDFTAGKPVISTTFKGFFEVVSGGETYLFSATQGVSAAEYVAETDPVFAVGSDGKPVMPTPQDVLQGELGDCYLEAALSSLAQRRPQAIVDMIQDYGKNVTVKLWDVDRSKKPTGFKQNLVRVEKSRVRTKGALSLDKGALWVGMIEKAYAAGRFGGGAVETSQARGKVVAAFDSIAAGYSDYATEVLTGKETKRIAVSLGKAQNAKAGDGLPWGDTEMKEYRTTAKVDGGSYAGLASYAALKDEGKVDVWMNWLNTAGRQSILDMFSRIRGDGTGYAHGAIRVEDFERIFTKTGLDADVAAPMLTDLQRHFPGKRGSGKYNEAQLKVWETISEAVDNKRLVMASSHKDAGRKSDGKGHSGGEAKSKGLVGGHAYTVLDWKVDPAGRKFVQMRNPWGSYSREYDFDKADKGKVKAGDDTAEKGVSWFELNDVTKRFHSIDVQ